MSEIVILAVCFQLKQLKKKTTHKLELLSAIASSNSYASITLSKLPACIHNSIDAR